MQSFQRIRAISFIVLVSFTLQACTALSQKGNVSQVNSKWLKDNCETSDFRNSGTFSYSNCKEFNAGYGYKAYECKFNTGTASGLFKLTSDNKMSLLCGVNTDGLVYSDGSSDTSTLGKVLIGVAVIGAAAALANSGGGGGSAPSCYDYKWDYLPGNGQWACRCSGGLDGGQFATADNCAYQPYVDNWP